MNMIEFPIRQESDNLVREDLLKMRAAKTVIKLVVITTMVLILSTPVFALDPYVSEIEPEQGTQGDFISAYIYGYEFEFGVSVSFSNPGVMVSNLNYIANDELGFDITIDQYAELGFCDVIVENPGGEQATLVNGFEVFDGFFPRLDYLQPDYGYQDTFSNAVMVFGEDFQKNGQFSFVGSLVPEIIDSNNISNMQYSLTIDIEANVPPGWYDLQVFFPDTPGGPVSLENAYEVRMNTPVIDYLDPNSSYQDEVGLSVNVYGSNFVSGGSFEFQPGGGPTVVNATYIDDTQYDLTIDIPADALPGWYDIIGTFPGFVEESMLMQAFEVIEIDYELYLEEAPALMGQGGDSAQTDFLFGINSNKPGDVNGPFYLYASEAVDPVSGEVIGLSYIDIAPTMTGSLTPGLYDTALLRAVIPMGIPSGEYYGDITFSAPGLRLQESVPFTISVQPGIEEILYPEMSRQELEIDLIWPGTDDEEEPEEILEETPLFEWASSARFFDFYLFDVTPASDLDERAGAVTYTQPIYIERDISDYRLFYPLGAEPLVPGHVYSWYVEAKDIPSYDPRVVDRQPQIISSEIFYFKYINILEAAAGEPEVMRIEVTPEFVSAELDNDYEFEAILELAGPGFANISWRVVPSSAAIVVSRGEYAYITPLRTGFVSVIAEVGGESAYAVMRVGGEDTQASVDPNPEVIARLGEDVERLEGLIVDYQTSGPKDVEALATMIEADHKRAVAHREYINNLRSAYKLLEPFLLTGEASESKPGYGDWQVINPFPGHIDLYVKSKTAYDSFVARNLTAFSDIQKLLDETKQISDAAGDDSFILMQDYIATDMALTNIRSNIVYNLERLEKELALVRNALEEDVRPFASMT